MLGCVLLAMLQRLAGAKVYLVLSFKASQSTKIVLWNIRDARERFFVIRMSLTLLLPRVTDLN